jgi:CDP-paratose 2-epimerase
MRLATYLWANLAKVRTSNVQNVLITGGAGFVGSNLAQRVLSTGGRITIYDNLARAGTERNLAWLQELGGDRLRFVCGDVRDGARLAEVLATIQPDAVFHFAAQVAVTTSVSDPRTDFEVNALGTFNLLEAARRLRRPPAIFFTSTNKVYGGLDDVAVVAQPSRWTFRDHPLGIAETQPLDFHSPYGCSKGTADQYVRDYARIYGLPTVVFRMSCIYGPRQFGNEDQGWVAHFLISALLKRPLTIYGDGKQVRDILFVSDLVNAFEAAYARIDQVAGEVFNIGGGPDNTLAIWSEFAPHIQRLVGHLPPVQRAEIRPGDQAVYISDTRKAAARLGWTPTVGVAEGISRLYHWIRENRTLFGSLATVPAVVGRAARNGHYAEPLAPLPVLSPLDAPPPDGLQ